MSWAKAVTVLCVVMLLAGAVVAADANNPPPLRDNPNPTGAMWLSIAHPGLGEWYNAGWGGWQNCNQRKFWLGFIPFYGWPGYLQVRSAVDAKRGKTW